MASTVSDNSNFSGTEPEPIRSVTEKISAEFPDVHHSLQDVEDHLDQDHVQAVGWTFGRPCYNPGSFQVRRLTGSVTSIDQRVFRVRIKYRWLCLKVNTKMDLILLKFTLKLLTILTNQPVNDYLIKFCKLQ